MKQKPTLNDLKLVINKWGGKNIPTVYLEGESWYEVLQILANKVYESLEWIEGYFNTDLESIVEKVLNEWIDDGTIQVIISEAMQWELDEYKVLVNKQFAQTEEQIDRIDNSFSSQLEQTKTDLQNELKLRTYKKYGLIDLSQFEGLKHRIDFSLWRGSDGHIHHNHKIDDDGYTNFYISRSGSSSNSGLTPEEPKAFMNDLIRTIESNDSVSKAKINYLDTLPRNNMVIALAHDIKKDYIFTSSGEFPLGNIQPTTISHHGGGIYKGNISYEPKLVVLTDKKDVLGTFQELKPVDSLNECSLTYESYFWDGTQIFINKENRTTDNVSIAISSGLIQLKFSGDENQKIIFDNLHLINGDTGQPFYFESSAQTKGFLETHNLVLQNSEYKRQGDSANGLATNGIKDVKTFDSVFVNITRDGLNYHNTKEVNGQGTVFEYNILCYNTGKDSSFSNNNLSSAHEGIHIIRVNTNGGKSKGPLIADVNGCYSLLIDCHVYDTGLTSLNQSQNSAFYFNDTPVPTYTPTPNGKAWLINCGGGSPTEWGINGDESFRGFGKIFVDNFVGTNIPDDINLTLL